MHNPQIQLEKPCKNDIRLMVKRANRFVARMVKPYSILKYTYKTGQPVPTGPVTGPVEAARRYQGHFRTQMVMFIGNTRALRRSTANNAVGIDVSAVDNLEGGMPFGCFEFRTIGTGVCI